jgi:hypothetical protein
MHACSGAIPAPAGPARTQGPRQQPPLDQAQVLAAAQACFGSLHQAAQQLQALGEDLHEAGASAPQQ